MTATNGFYSTSNRTAVKVDISGPRILATDDGQVNLTAQPVAKFLAPATEGMKNFHWSEARYLQFRWEMYNAFNHVNYNAGSLGTTLGTSSFGRIFSAGSARTMQLGLKFIF